MNVYEFLTLTDREACLIIDALNGHLRNPHIAPHDELTLAIADSIGSGASGDRLDLKWSIDGSTLVARIAGLTDLQAAITMDCVAAFWRNAADQAPIGDRLHAAGLC